MYVQDDEIKFHDRAKQIIEQGNQNIVLANYESTEQLREVIRFFDWKYYVQDNPVLSDFEYDSLFKILKDIEQKHPGWITPDSPTQRISKSLSEKFETLGHLVPMLSLDNSYNSDDLRDWDARCKAALPGEKIYYTVEPKYDGAGISLYYENNLLQRGLTRGDGIQGEDITANIKQMKSVPLSAAFMNENVNAIEIRGEVVIPKNKFEAYNQQRLEEGLSLLANPRNAASGTLRMLDPSEVSKRGLHAVVYHVSYHTNENNQPDRPQLKNHYDILQWLYHCGFSTPVKEMKLCENIQEVIDFCEEFEEKRDNLPIEIDGMVVKVNNIDQQERLGQTSHHPRWAMAYKFKARQATSKLLKVEFQVGRTGAITPVAKIQPVPLGGVVISSISLFNEDVVREKDLRIGDTVLVERAGDVIPYIVKPLEELRTGEEQEIVFPHNCPVCNEKLFKIEDEVAWRCVNIVCPAQVVEHLIHYAGKDAMDIRNLGEANIQRFYELGWLKNIADIYRLDFLQVRKLPKMGDKSVLNLMEAVENSKLQPLSRLIFGLGIRYVGATTAKTLAASVDHLFDLKDKSKEWLQELPDIGEKVATSVYDFFHVSENIELLNELEELGVNMKANKTASEGKLEGKTFLFTGTLTQFKRSEAQEMVEAKGGKILSGVSSKLDYLITGDAAGSKLEKAKKIGTIEILNEEQFLKMIE